MLDMTLDEMPRFAMATITCPVFDANTLANYVTALDGSTVDLFAETMKAGNVRYHLSTAFCPAGTSVLILVGDPVGVMNFVLNVLHVPPEAARDSVNMQE